VHRQAVRFRRRVDGDPAVRRLLLERGAGDERLHRARPEPLGPVEHRHRLVLREQLRGRELAVVRACERRRDERDRRDEQRYSFSLDITSFSRQLVDRTRAGPWL